MSEYFYQGGPGGGTPGGESILLICLLLKYTIFLKKKSNTYSFDRHGEEAGGKADARGHIVLCLMKQSVYLLNELKINIK